MSVPPLPPDVWRLICQTSDPIYQFKQLITSQETRQTAIERMTKIPYKDRYYYRGLRWSKDPHADGLLIEGIPYSPPDQPVPERFLKMRKRIRLSSFVTTMETPFYNSLPMTITVWAGNCGLSLAVFKSIKVLVLTPRSWLTELPPLPDLLHLSITESTIPLDISPAAQARSLSLDGCRQIGGLTSFHNLTTLSLTNHVHAPFVLDLSKLKRLTMRDTPLYTISNIEDVINSLEYLDFSFSEFTRHHSDDQIDTCMRQALDFVNRSRSIKTFVFCRHNFQVEDMSPLLLRSRSITTLESTAGNLDYSKLHRTCPNLKILKVSHETGNYDLSQLNRLSYLHLEFNRGSFKFRGMKIPHACLIRYCPNIEQGEISYLATAPECTLTVERLDSRYSEAYDV
jgi:hypothetical protein